MFIILINIDIFLFMNFLEFSKTLKVIHSCVNIKQLGVAENYLNLFCIKNSVNKTFIDSIKQILLKKKKQLLNE